MGNANSNKFSINNMFRQEELDEYFITVSDYVNRYYFLKNEKTPINVIWLLENYLINDMRIEVFVKHFNLENKDIVNFILEPKNAVRIISYGIAQLEIHEEDKTIPYEDTDNLKYNYSNHIY